MTPELWYLTIGYLIGFIVGGVFALLIMRHVLMQMLRDQHIRFVTAIQTLLGRGEAERPAA